MTQTQVQIPIVIPNPAATKAVDVSNAVAGGSLYVGDLDLNVNESQLCDLFNQIGRVLSVRVCRDLTSRRSLGYGYVNFADPDDAARALDILNFTPVNGRAIRVMYSQRDPSIRKSGSGNIFIKNLDKSIDNKALQDTFASFGNILSCKVATDPNGKSKGHGFVQFENEEAAEKAIEKLNGMLINDKQVFVGPFVRRQERESVQTTKFNNIYVKNLGDSTTDDDLKKVFGEFGIIKSPVVMRDGDGKSKCFGFVSYEDADDAARAVDALNGKKFDDKEWYVGRAQKKSERELELKGMFEQSLKEAADKYQGNHLFIKNLDDSIDDYKLRDLFSEYGTIISCKVLRNPNGVSRGSGIVGFSTPDEASRAIMGMNGKMEVNKPLYVALLQHKEERKARLQAQFSQGIPTSMAPSIAPRMPTYPPAAPGIGQQIFYGQSPPMIPPHAGFGYRPQPIPGMRPGASPIPNFLVPLMPHGQQGRHPMGRRGAGLTQQGQMPLPVMQQMMPGGSGHMRRHSPGNSTPGTLMAGVAAGIRPVSYGMSGVPGITQPVHVGTLASALANASPEQQRTMLGENLYPLVELIEPEHAAKVTGMLLEMDQTEVLHLLESPNSLKGKVIEAMKVLKNVAQQQENSQADQLAVLSLNDNLVS